MVVAAPEEESRDAEEKRDADKAGDAEEQADADTAISPGHRRQKLYDMSKLMKKVDSFSKVSLRI